MLDGRITLEAIESIPNPTGIWLPVTREEAENVVLPRLASGLGDKLILPAIKEYDSQYVYATELGHEFYASRSPLDLVTLVRYFVDYTNYGEREDFIRSFMKNAGFNVSEITSGENQLIVYGGLESMWVHTQGASTVINFEGWTNDYPSPGYMMPIIEATKRAYDVASRYTHLYSNDENCKFELREYHYYSYGSTNLYIHAGVPVYRVHVGDCWDSTYSSPRADPTRWMIDGVTGEVAWPQEHADRLTDDWFEQLDVPEWARVKGHD